ncbi:MAG: GNAT family N-acetyltransferase, partial [Planctomycetota bacterium]|nr:GNAT family N-acetyltransferase [Planctomycetota bacterium]
RALARACEDYNYEHTWEYTEALARRRRATAEHRVVLAGDRPLGLAGVRVYTVPILGAGIAYVRGGPLVRFRSTTMADWSSHLERCLAALIDEYVDRRGLTLRVLPPIGPAEWDARQALLFAEAGFVSARRLGGYRTMVLDLDPPPEQIRAAFRAKWRNGLNQSERAGLTIRTGTSNALFDRFAELHDDLRETKSFRVDLDAAFYAHLQHRLDEADRLRVTLAERNGRLVAGHVASLLGDTCVFLLGAAGAAGRRTKASYLLQWHAIRAARTAGCRAYDLGGVDPDANPGVFHFKQGLGGREVHAPGPFDRRPRRPRQLLLSGAEHLLARARQGHSAS